MTNRETIKFRAWDTKQKCYLRYYDVNVWHEDALLNDIFENERMVFQQYTGLKDKNDVEIYEGDILERIGNGSFCKIVIYWDNYNCAFISKNSFNLHGKGSPISDHNINISDWTYWVVSGNIFENSELLEA